MVLENLSYSLWVYFFIFARIAGITFFLPFFSTRFAPVQVKVFITLFISYLVLLENNGTFPINSSPLAIVFYLVMNFLFGTTIGLIANIIFYAFQFAGETIGIQIGFAMANVFDPVTNDEISLISEFSFLLSVFLFFLFKGPMILYSIIIDSFDKIPIVFTFNPEGYFVFSQKLFDVFSIGIQLAMPLVAFMILIKVALGIVSRLIPQVNVFMVGIPLEILVGFLLLIGVIVIWEDQFSYLFFQLIEWIRKSMMLLSQ